MTAETSVDARATPAFPKTSWLTQMFVREDGSSAYSLCSGGPFGSRYRMPTRAGDWLGFCRR
jgi:hypothetical protein